jgi:phage-related protein (TIGR01555 family)
MTQKNTKTDLELNKDSKTNYNFDGFNQILNAASSLRDMFKHITVSNTNYTDERLETAFKNDAMIRKIVSRPVFDGTKKHFKIENAEAEIIAFLEKEYKRLGLYKKLESAWTQSRIYGQAYFFLVTNEDKKNYKDEIQEAPLLEVQVFSSSMYGQNIDQDVTSSNFGLPSQYNIYNSYLNITEKSTPSSIHHSRVTRFDGEYLPEDYFINNQYRNGSIIQKVYNACGQYQGAMDNLVPLLNTANMAILKVENLMDHADQDTSKKISDRLRLLQKSRVENQLMLLTQGDEFINHGLNLSGIKDLVENLTNNMVAASGMPRTILLGESPKGNQSTGKSELVDYYDYVKQEQVRVLEPSIRYITDYLLKSEYGKEFEYDVEFPPLLELSELEEAEYRLKVAQQMQVYLDAGILTQEEVRDSLFTAKFTQNITLDDEGIDFDDIEDDPTDS